MNFIQAMYQPQFRFEGLDRLDLLDWDEIHDVVQSELGDLDKETANLCPGVRVTSGRNQGRNCPLFSYRVYSALANSDVDPVVAGIRFSPGSSGVVIHGDLSGETIGDVLLDFPSKAAVGKLAIVEEVRSLARQIVQNADRVAAALNDTDRRA
jgi:hypothetical protein